MTNPAFIYAFLLASFLGTSFHFWKGGGFGRLVANLILSWIGFALLQFIGQQTGFSILTIGSIQAGLGSLGSMVMLFSGHWFSKIDSV
jgi:hypothetical protein